MYNNHLMPDGNTINGTVGGTLMVIFNLHAEDLVKTALLAGVGALVSFLVSYGLTALTRKFKRWNA